MPTIGYRNLFETGVVTVDSEDAAYPKENAYDWLPYPGDVWKPAASGTHYINVDIGTAASADYFAVHAHDIDSIKLQYSNDNFAADINDVQIQSQNMIKYSEEIDNAVWSKSASIVVTANADVAPDGTLTADTVTGISNDVINSQSLTMDPSKIYAASLYIKKDSVPVSDRGVALRINTGGNSYIVSGIIIDTKTGQFVLDGNVAYISASVTLVGNYWLAKVTGQTTDVLNNFVALEIMPERNAVTVAPCTLWGAQLTETSAVKPYVKTTSAAYPAIAPDGSKLIYREFTSLSSRYWRFEVVKASAASSLGVVSLGEKLTIPRTVTTGYSPANLSRENKYLNSTSDEGQFLGRRLISNGSATDLSFDILTPEFVRGDWDVFMSHAEIKPFFYAWSYDDHTTEAAFCWTTGKITPPVYSKPNFMRVSLKVKANI